MTQTDKEKLEALKSRLGKKMTLTDKEKIDKALKEIKELEKYWESEHAISLHANPQVRAIMGDVRQIKKTLEP